MSAPLPASHNNTFRVVATVWLLTLSVLVAIDRTQIDHPIKAPAPSLRPDKLAQLEGDVTALQSAVSGIEHEPPPIRAAEFQALERAQSAHFAQIDSSLANTMHGTDIAPLEHQLTRLAAEVWRLRHPLTQRPQPGAHPRSDAARQPSEVSPPFKVMGTELRGSDEFLSVVPPDAPSLSAILLLHPGEADGNWKLDVIEGRTAVFEVENQVRRVPIP